MRSSKETYQKVACACSEYEKNYDWPGTIYHLKNACCDQKPSCLICKQFKDEHCGLDLYDKIVARIGNNI